MFKKTVLAILLSAVCLPSFSQVLSPSEAFQIKAQEKAQSDANRERQLRELVDLRGETNAYRLESLFLIESSRLIPKVHRIYNQYIPLIHDNTEFQKAINPLVLTEIKRSLSNLGLDLSSFQNEVNSSNIPYIKESPKVYKAYNSYISLICSFLADLIEGSIRVGLYNDAAAILDSAQHFSKSNTTFQVQRALLLCKVGDTAQAQDILKSAITSYRSNPQQALRYVPEIEPTVSFQKRSEYFKMILRSTFYCLKHK